MSGMDDFAFHLTKLRESLNALSAVEQLAAVALNIEELITLYAEIAALQPEFHAACERRDYPRQGIRRFQ
jgi:hypothetical protein